MVALRVDLMGRNSKIELARANASARPGMTLVEVGDAVVRARISGDGPAAAVLVPDPPNVIEHYDRLFTALAPDVRVICFELAGFGFSVPPPAFGFSIAEHADVAAAVLRRLGVEGGLWAASCLAAYVGLGVSRRHPDVLSSLVCGQAPSWDEELNWARRLDPRGILTAPVVGQLLVHFTKRRIASGWYRVAALPETREWLADTALDALDRGASYSLASALQASFGQGDTLAATQLPTTFIWGARDRTHRTSDPESARRNAKRSEIVTFTRSAHFPDLEEPERFAELVREKASRQ